MLKTKKGDFVEIDFIARVKEGKVFDTTLKEEAEKAGIINNGNKETFKPFKLCIGKDMILHGFDMNLHDKEIGKYYEIELVPKDAFGNRNPKLVKTFSSSAFIKKGMIPEPGAFVNINDMIAKIISVSGGRVVADFNNPLADKIIFYKFRINRIIDQEREKIETIASFYFRDFEIKDKKEGKGFELIVKAGKTDALDKRIKEMFPNLEIRYS